MTLFLRTTNPSYEWIFKNGIIVPLRIVLEHIKDGDTIEIINEGTKEVRENRLEILTSHYEHFRSNPGEGISKVFERFNKLINDLNLNGKFYTKRER